VPGKGFFTIPIKPLTVEKLQKMTEKMHSMFIPTTLFMMMNEIENGDYILYTHKFSMDLPGNYISITIRSDVHDWLEKNFEKFAEEYAKIYHVKRFTFTKFVNYFIINMLESKIQSQNQIINLNEVNFSWLQKEYQKQKRIMQDLTFEEFTNTYIGNLFLNIDKEKIIT